MGLFVIRHTVFSRHLEYTWKHEQITLKVKVCARSKNKDMYYSCLIAVRKRSRITWATCYPLSYCPYSGVLDVH